MTRITAAAAAIGAAFLIGSAALLGGCASTGSSAASEESSRYAVGLTPEAEILAELGEPGVSSYVYRQPSLDQLEAKYLAKGEKLNQYLDVTKLLYKTDVYTWSDLQTGDVTIAFFVFDRDGGTLVHLEEKNFNLLRQDDAEIEKILKETLEKQTEMFEAPGVARVEAELARIVQNKKRK